MDIFEELEKSSYVVELTQSQLGSTLPQCGTAFAIAPDLLLSANHVVRFHKPGTAITLENPITDSKIISLVDRQDEHLDLVLLRIVGNDRLSSYLELSEKIPHIGSEVIWGGYPKLIGEKPLSRFRAGAGIISTNPFNNDGIFFEVDGIFNSGHSGGAIIDKITEKVIGVISASAGTPYQMLSDIEEIKKKIDILTQLHEKGAGNSISTNMTFESPYGKEDLERMLRELGLQNKTLKPSETKPGAYDLRLKSNEAMVAVIKNNQNIIQLLSKIADQSYQMGLGVGSGGKPLMKFVCGV